jgi:hypothetical protein
MLYRISPLFLALPALGAVPDLHHPADELPRVLPGVIEDGAFVVRLAEPAAAHLDPDVYDRLLEDAAGHAPVGALSVEVVARDGAGVERPLRELLRRPVPRPIEEDELLPPNALRAAPGDLPGESAGFLSGRAVYVSQCHGFIWFDSLGRFSTQRGVLFSTVEDFHNPEGADQYLVRYLENAGARVFTAKERDINPLMSIADDDGSGYAESGAGFVDGAAGFADTSPYVYGENPFASGGTRSFPADGGAVATWTPDVPADGTYAVYVSWDANGDNASDAHYVITHPGGTIDRWFDQKVHGSTWQYVETLWLTAGSSLTVELVGDSSEAGATLSADAVRIGGGMDDVSRHGVTNGRPRWESGAIQYVQFNGAPTSVYDPYGDGTSSDGGSDPSARSAWADWEHPTGEDAVYLSWHSNAATSTARGTITYYGGTCAPVAGSYDLASTVQDELIESIHGRWDPTWYDRGIGSACFSEVDSGFNNEMPSILVELAFHDNVDDAAHLKSPTFRDDASRAMYRGIVRYFAERDGIAPSFSPEPPVGLKLVHEGGELVASWSPGPSGSPLGDAADSYLLFRSADGRAWDSGTAVSGTSSVVEADVGETVFVKVAALNEGGASFPSAVVGALRSPSGEAPILVIDAFDRLDAGQLDYEAVPNIGTVTRMNVLRMNPGDIAVAHGNAIAGAGWPFDTVQDELLDQIDLSTYALVVWATGEESTFEESFSDDQQQTLRDYVDVGGTLWTSGAEILWDLDELGSDTDRAFAEEVLGALMAADAATTTLVDGEGALAGVGPMDFGVGDGAPYPVEWPDVLDSTRPVVARYGDGTVAGVLGDGVAMLGFPFECIGDPDVRTDAAAAIIAALLPDLQPPTTTTGTTGTTGGDSGTPGTTGSTDTEDPTGPGRDDFPALPGPTSVVAEEKGCGCGGGSSPGPLGWLAAALVLWVRRR